MLAAYQELKDAIRIKRVNDELWDEIRLILPSEKPTRQNTLILSPSWDVNLHLGRSDFNKIYNLPCCISLIEATFSDITNRNAILYDTENCPT
jgi:hypothetical protein